MISIAVVESSQVAEARRQAARLGRDNGFSEEDCGRAAIVATELATNLVKHGGGGEILIGAFEDAKVRGVEILALDRGRGMVNVQNCFADGYSSAGTAGRGLGAVARQSNFVDVVSWPNLGTAVLARLERGGPRPGESARVPWGAVDVPKPGEEVNGDSWSVDDAPDGLTLFVADGLGHGPEAAEASVQAVRMFQRHKGHQIATILDYVHGGLRATRGAAVSIARVGAGGDQVCFAGIGNVGGAIVAPTGLRRMVSLAGTAGHVVRKIQSFKYPISGGLVVLYSDGLATNWSLDPYPNLINAHPTLIAGVLYRDFARRRDDVTILVGVRT